MADNKLISKVTLGGVTYDLKDQNARERLTTLEGLVAGGVQIIVADSLPTASRDTVGKIYFISHVHGEKDIYDEYLTVIGGTEEAPIYSWEKIGNTDIDLSGYAKNNHTHTVTSNVTATEQKYTPAGNITLPNFSSSVTTDTDSVATVTDAGKAYTMTDGGVSQAADTKSGFATEGIIASYVEATETLVFAAAGTAQAVTAAGAVTYTKPVLSGSLPTFGTKTVLTGATVATTADGKATFAGTEADITPSLVNNAVTSGTNVNPS